MDVGYVITILLSVVTLIAACFTLRGALRVWFVLTLLLTVSYQILPLSEEGYGTWIRHAPVYVGQICFYFLLVALDKQLQVTRPATVKQSKTRLSKVTAAIPLMPLNTWSYLTQQGLEHIMTVPLFTIVVVSALTRGGMDDPRYRFFTLVWSVARFCFVMEHVSEFIFESLALGGDLRTHVEIIEKCWMWAGLSILLLSLYTYKTRMAVSR